MAENKKSFVLYADLLQNIEHLTNEEKGILFNHLLEYVNDKDPILTDRLLLTAWKPIEMQLKRDLRKFKEVKAKRTEAGKRSAQLRALKNNEQTSTNSTSVESVEQTSTNPTDNVNVNVNVNDNVNVILLKKETKDKNIVFDFKKKLIEYGFEKSLVEDWLKVRKTKKATNTETAFISFIKEIESRPCDINEALKIAVTNSWSGFKHKWVDNLKTSINEKPNGATQQQTTGKRLVQFSFDSAIEAISGKAE